MRFNQSHLGFCQKYFQTTESGFVVEPRGNNWQDIFYLPSHKREGNNIQILWWNIAGEQNFDTKKRNRTFNYYSVLEYNLVLLTYLPRHSSPDIIVLGEFYRPAITMEVQDLLKRIYPYHALFTYKSQKPDYGFLVLSKYPFNKVIQKPLDWDPPGMNEPQKKIYRQQIRSMYVDELYPRVFNRTFYVLKFFDSQRKRALFQMTPVHLIHPWKTNRNNPIVEKFSYRYAKKLLKKIPLVYDVLFQRGNPLTNQLTYLLEAYQENIDQLNQLGYLMIGDFNLMSLPVVNENFYTLYSQGYSDITNILINPSEVVWPTFPTFGLDCLTNKRQDIPGMQLDYVFTNDLIQGRTVMLPLAGSDHFPILFTFAKN